MMGHPAGLEDWRAIMAPRLRRAARFVVDLFLVFLLVVLLAAVTSCSAAPYWDKTGKDYSDNVTWQKVEPWSELQARCGRTAGQTEAWACAIRFNEAASCLILAPYTFDEAVRLYPDLYRHEMAHCYGWLHP